MGTSVSWMNSGSDWGLYVSWPADVLVDVEKFWMEVHNHTDASGEKDFVDVGKFALSMLAIPVIVMPQWKESFHK